MADKKISELTPLTGANLADNDEFAVVDTSATETKAITFGELKTALDTSTGFVRITGDTMTGGLTVPTVDINGGTIDGTVIGGSTPAAISGTDLTVEDTQASGGVGIDIINVGDGGVSTTPYTYISSKLNPSRNGGEIRFTRAGVYGSAATADSNIELYTALDDVNTLVFKASSGGDIFFYEDTGTTPKFSWSSANETISIGIGASSTATISAYSRTVSAGLPSALRIIENTGASTHWDIGSDGGALPNLKFYVNSLTTPRMTLSSTGAATFLDSVGHAAGTALLPSITRSADLNTGIFFPAADTIAASTDGTERMRIDSSGNVGIGTSSPARPIDVVAEANDNPLRLRARGGGTSAYITFTSNDAATTSALIGNPAANTLAFYTNGFTERLRITSAGNVGIGTSSPAFKLDVEGDPRFYVSGDGIIPTFQAYRNNAGQVTLRTDFARGTLASPAAVQSADKLAQWQIRGHDGTDFRAAAQIESHCTAAPSGSQVQGDFRFLTNSGSGVTERMRIDASGNLLVGTTNSNPVANNVDGVQFGDGRIRASKSDRTVLELNRRTTDGSIAEFRKDGTTVGSIGAEGGDLTIGTGTNCGLQFNDGNNAIRPFNVAGNAPVDNVVDLGLITSRFDDIYATNGTIQTSDRNEKQDIEELDEAERRVAVAAKGLLRKFRWKNAVEEKGDDARIHFGIIAQDLQAAFEAEGLDAGRYAMFIHSTWTDEETGEERSRMGVRYPQLLAFIIAAI